ncbi:RidA family protein [Clostridium oryzae]|uniref:2-iminobutanoate/2-iminopropanoate deaminase n=1 Tax=Clostridium oryzae TaxID=1450648 RepID=A0A1V4IVF9_9CLOT|nr:RidA family protein [Clostridium oryzae]OPJ63774.1 2-iminobutanoate/2-iminopropanoate deaminase [Clostridium oryzae]
MKEIIKTEKAPAAIGPYSQGIKIGDLVFTSGQLPVDMLSGELVVDDIRRATRASLDNVKAILEQGGSSLENVIKVVMFLKNMDDFASVNEEYAKYFPTDAPARSCVQVAKLPKDAPIEIEAIGAVK